MYVMPTTDASIQIFAAAKMYASMTKTKRTTVRQSEML